MEATIIADTLGSKKIDKIFWRQFYKKSATGWASNEEQNRYIEFGDVLLKKQHRGVQLFNHLVEVEKMPRI